MIKSMKNKLIAMLCVAVMTLGIVTPSFMNTVQAAVAQKTVYIDVEKNVLFRNVLHEPVKVTLDETATILDATKKAVDDSNVASSGNYIQAFKDSETSFDYMFKNKLKCISKGVVYRTDLPKQKIVDDSEWLREKEYTGISGWMFTVNNTMNDSKSNYYTAGTDLANLPEYAVIRWEFTEAMGADLGLIGSAWIPNAVTAQGYYDWSCAQSDAFFTRADKTELIRAMANHADKKDKAYTNALNNLKDLQAEQKDVDGAVAGLK